MSHGGGESECVHKKSIASNLRRNNEEFAHAVANISVAQISESVGFESYQQSALETLSDVALRYLRDTIRSAQSYANLAGRSDCNAFDFIQSLEEHSSTQGLTSASNADSCLAMSSTVKEMVQFISDSDTTGIGVSFPFFPVPREQKHICSFLDSGKEPPGNHIPSWLPSFPDHHDSQPICNVPEAPQFCPPSDAATEEEAPYVNPFIAPPLPYGTKEVSEILPPAKLLPASLSEDVKQNSPIPDTVSVMNTFGPALNSVSSLPDTDDGKKKPLLNQRPTVYFKLAAGKKVLAKSSELRLQKKDIDKREPLFTTLDEKNEKKKKAERILKQSMEIVEELAQI